MNNPRFKPDRDPFGTLISLTAAALTGPLARAQDLASAAGGQPARRPSLLDRLDRWLWKSRQRDLERALTSAADAAEVEARLRDRERGLLQRYY